MKQIYVNGQERTVDGIRLPKDADKSEYERFIPEAELETPSVSVSISLSGDSIKASSTAVANNKTGSKTASKTLASLGLKVDDGSGGILDWAECVCSQVFTPSVDVNEELTFQLTGMTAAPDLIIITCSNKTGKVNYDYGGGAYAKNMGGMVAPQLTMYQGYIYYRSANTSQGYTVSNIINGTGITEVAADHFKIQTPKYGTTQCYWRADRTYIITAAKLK